MTVFDPDALRALVREEVAAALRERRDGQRWMTVKETAEYLGCSEVAIRRRISRGRIPAKKQGRSVLIDRQALDRELERS